MPGFSRIEIYRNLRFFDRLHRSGTCNAAARACHSFQKIAIVLSGFGELKKFLALLLAFRVRNLDLLPRIHLCDHIHHGFRDTAGNRKVSSILRCGLPCAAMWILS